MAGLLLRYELIRSREYPGAADAEDVDVLGDVGRKQGKRRDQVHDAPGSVVQYPLSRRAIDVQPLERAVGLDRDGHHQAAVDALVARGLRVVGLAHGLDLGAPVLDVAGAAEFLRAGADVAPARPLLVALPFARDARLQPRD